MPSNLRLEPATGDWTVAGLAHVPDIRWQVRWQGRVYAGFTTQAQALDYCQRMFVADVEIQR